MDRFFVYHPVFAWVIALFIALFGFIAVRSLPIEQYPAVAPPALNLDVTYNGADAETLDRNVVSIISKEINGVDNFLYMSATSRANGTAQITVTFQPGTDLDIARTQVQDRLSRVTPRLPEEVRQVGVTITKAAQGFLGVVALESRSGQTSAVALGNFASNRLSDEIKRIRGVGDVVQFGSQYAMRIWLDPEKLAGYGISPSETLKAVQEQNSQTAGGGLGEQPVARLSEFNAKIVTQNRFSTPEQFRQIIVRENPDGSLIRLGDVARVELGAESFNITATVDGHPIAGMGVQLASGANALATEKAIVARLKELEPTFPPDIKWSIPYDTTPFISASVRDVETTLVIAMALVFLVMFVFLQDWRPTLIAAIVVPISLGGACVGLAVFGMSINILSLLAMVVAIGILVDDAIVVVENVDRIMKDEGLNRRRATVKAMGQITGAIIGITLVLVAVFLPMAFFPGSTGGIYRQFSVTLAVSVFVSAALALTLTPALCGMILKEEVKGESDKIREKRLRRGPAGWFERFFSAFNQAFAKTRTRYGRGVDGILGKPLRWLGGFAVALAVTAFLFIRLPGGFLPTEDQGYLFVVYTAAPGATMARTAAAIQQAEAFFEKQPQVRSVVSVVGFSFFGQGQSTGLSFVTLKPWEERPGEVNSASALVAKANGALANLPEAQIFALDPPPIQALGNATGFTFKIEDRGGVGAVRLLEARDQILAQASKSKVLVGVRPEGLPPTPELYVDIDRIKARALGVQITDVNQTLAIAFGSYYANDFSYLGDVLRVYLQADASQRMTPADLLALKVPNSRKEMVPFSSFTTVRWTSGPQQVERYNGYPSQTVSGVAAPGYASGDALVEMERIAAPILQGGLGYEWTGTAREERQSSGQIGALLGLSLLVIYLLLAALYGSWPVPLAALMAIPFGVLGAVVFAMARGLSADIYFNIGLITVIGLSAKNAILIVEFALDEERAGRSALEGVKEAARERLRPILMTSLAFVFGMAPLVIASGAGAASRQVMGTGVMGGMIFVTGLGIFFTPVFYYSARRWLSRDNDLATADAREEQNAVAPSAAEAPHA
jgi:multidrug efflux pump